MKTQLFKMQDAVKAVFRGKFRALNYRGKNVKNTNTWRLNNTLLSNQEITEEIKDGTKKYLETNDNENTMIQNL